MEDPRVKQKGPGRGPDPDAAMPETPQGVREASGSPCTAERSGRFDGSTVPTSSMKTRSSKQQPQQQQGYSKQHIDSLEAVGHSGMIAAWYAPGYVTR